MVYIPYNGADTELSQDFAHGTDASLYVNDATVANSNGGYFRVYDNSEFAIYEYTGISSSEITGLDQTNVTQKVESTSSYTFSSGSTVQFGLVADYVGDIIDILLGNDTWPGGQDAGNNLIENLSQGTFNSEYDNGTVSTDTTIDWTNGQKQVITLSGSITLSFTAPNGPCNLTLRIVQDSTGGRTLTWPTSVLWPAGSKMGLSSSANAEDVLSIYYNGSNYYAVLNKAFA